MKSHTKYGLVIGLVALVLICGLALAASAKGRPDPDNPVVLVTGGGSPGLLYDTIVLGPLPNKGPFQQLFGAPTGPLSTMYGPGDPGYLGGRWWVDSDGVPGRTEGDTFFLCPLLPPGFSPAP